jgi:dienelactone hydrolase
MASAASSEGMAMSGWAGGIPRRWRACGSVLALLLSLLAPPPASAMHKPGHGMPPVVIQPLPLGNVAWGILAVPDEGAAAEQRPAAILLMGDGESSLDGRTDLYAQRLLSLGFALLDADFEGLLADEGTPVHPQVEPLHRRLGLALAALDDNPLVDHGRLAAIGIGVGARAVLEGWAQHGGRLRAAVLLYPVCDAELLGRAPALRPEPGHGSILIVHGDADESEVAQCAALVRALGGAERGIARYVLRGADIGWDIDGGVVEARSRIPDPAQPNRRRTAQPDSERAAVALDRILLFLRRALTAPQLSSSESQ